MVTQCLLKLEDDRHPGEHLLLHRIGWFRIDLHLNEHGNAHDEGPNANHKVGAEHRYLSRIEGDEAEQIEDDSVGSGCERSLIQPKNGACRISIVMTSTL